MIEFKQIIGRGTRLFDGKDYFTIYDFVKAYELFNDPEWDGDPLEPDPPGQPREKKEGDPEPPEPPVDGDPPRKRLVIKLADGKERTFQHMSASTFWDASGKPISAAQFVESLFGQLPELFKDEDELRRIWSDPETRAALIAGLAERGFDGEQLAQDRTRIANEPKQAESGGALRTLRQTVSSPRNGHRHRPIRSAWPATALQQRNELWQSAERMRERRFTPSTQSFMAEYDLAEA